MKFRGMSWLSSDIFRLCGSRVSESGLWLWSAQYEEEFYTGQSCSGKEWVALKASELYHFLRCLVSDIP